MTARETIAKIDEHLRRLQREFLVEDISDDAKNELQGQYARLMALRRSHIRVIQYGR